MAKLPDGFVALRSLTRGAPDPASALADIRRLYFKTTRQTIDADLAHAIELLKSLPTEEDRERATVFMEGLTEMRREWQKAPAGGGAGRAVTPGKAARKPPAAGPGRPSAGRRKPTRKAR